MTHRHRIPAVLLLLSLSFSPSFGDMLDPTRCTVLPADLMNGVVLSPGTPTPIQASILRITLRFENGAPAANGYVEITFHPGITTCPGAVLTGITNADGYTELILKGGGCVMDQPNWTAASIRANGVEFRAYQNAKSPDWNGASGDFRVDIADLLSFVTAYQIQAPGCHDYDNTGATNLADLMIFAEAFMPQHTCP